jgi:FlaA1/EpsC-like NDP-sugar epimerase/lipopolysaccharide/colanic/teichoic acid biosynthesis glycosyltransferase
MIASTVNRILESFEAVWSGVRVASQPVGTFYFRCGKRILDAVAAAIGLAISAPAFLFCAALVRMSGRGPIFFRHNRVGQHGETFRLVKFRTMRMRADEKCTQITARGDTRVTPVGRFLRRTKLDELPQLLNVLRGEMSLVGPRPETSEHVAGYNEIQRRILHLKPGITGAASLRYLNEESLLAEQADPEDFYLHDLMPRKLQLDLRYSDQLGLATDLRLILLTLAAVLNPFRKKPTMNAEKTKIRFNPYTKSAQVALDAGIFAGALTLAYLIRFEGMPKGPDAAQFFLWLPVLVVARLIVNREIGVYRFIWRFVSLPDVLAIARSLGIVTIFILGLRLLWPVANSWAGAVKLPLSVIALEYLLSLIGSTGARVLRRVLYERSCKPALAFARVRRRVILYGAGKAGRLLLREFESRNDIEVAGFLDDDPKKADSVIAGARVVGNGASLAGIARQFRVEEVVISMATANRQTLMRILGQCRDAGVPAKIIPSLQEILDGRVRISELREVQIEDLLGRRSVSLPEVDDGARQTYAGKRILVTGASGSIGSELVRQLIALKPAKLLMLDQDENGIYELEQQVAARLPHALVESEITDIKQRGRITEIFQGFRPEIVFHAAAHKHLSLMEKAPCEAVLNNVLGTKIVLDACIHSGTERFVFVSTDKAVNPSSVMGATKKIGEILVQSVAEGSPMRAACVRFGNVMGSRGSVIPLFQKQIREGGPLTVTHPDVVRFFMTIPEAVQLILCAGCLAQHGEVFVMDMGSPRKILELAQEMILLSGLEPGKDIDIAITGLRPGEKLNEELTGPAEAPCRTPYEKLSKVIPFPIDGVEIRRQVASLVKAAKRNDRHAIYGILKDMEIGFCSDPQSFGKPQNIAQGGTLLRAEPRRKAEHLSTSAREAAVALSD